MICFTYQMIYFQNCWWYPVKLFDSGNSSSAETRIYQDNLVNAMAVDALAPCVAGHQQQWYWKPRLDPCLPWWRILTACAMPFVRNYRICKHVYIDGLAQDCSNSIANALELLQSCAKPSICYLKIMQLEESSEILLVISHLPLVPHICVS